MKCIKTNNTREHGVNLGVLFQLLGEHQSMVYALFSETPYIKESEADMIESRSDFELHTRTLSDGWVFWDNYLCLKYGRSILNNSNCLIYNKEIETIPVFSDMKWDVAYLDIDGNEIQLFIQKAEFFGIADKIPDGKRIEYPGMIFHELSVGFH